MDIPVHDDDVCQCLFRDVDPEFDSLTQMALELLIPGLLLI